MSINAIYIYIDSYIIYIELGIVYIEILVFPDIVIVMRCSLISFMLDSNSLTKYVNDILLHPIR